MSITRATACHYYPRAFALLCLWMGLALVVLPGCRRSVPATIVNADTDGAHGTISGIVQGPAGSVPVSGRTVEVVNLDTGKRHAATTGVSGAFAVEVPAGRYRVELALRDGETLLKHPDVVDLDSAGADTHVELVLGAIRVTRPRGPAYRVDNGLGAPSA